MNEYDPCIHCIPAEQLVVIDRQARLLIACGIPFEQLRIFAYRRLDGTVGYSYFIGVAREVIP